MHSPELQGLGFEAMLRLAQPLEKNLKRAGNRETELWHMTRADPWHLSGISGPNSAPAVIKINALQVMYGEDTFKSPALPYCFGTKVKQEDVALVQIQEILGLMGGNHPYNGGSMALASLRQRLQQAATELGEDLVSDIVLTLRELDVPASTHFGHALGLMSSFSTPY